MTEDQLEIVVTQILLSGAITQNTCSVDDEGYVISYVADDPSLESRASEILERVWAAMGVWSIW